MAATVTALRPSTGGQKRRPVLVDDAVTQFLATPRCNQSPHTHRAYAGALHRFVPTSSARTGHWLPSMTPRSLRPSPPCGAAERRPPSTATGPPSPPGWPGTPPK